jgi:hypothetical protein
MSLFSPAANQRDFLPGSACRLPIEIWLRIALFASDDMATREKQQPSIEVASPAGLNRRYFIPPPNLTPGSAPLTPLGAIDGGSSRNDQNSHTHLSSDYFGTWGFDARGASLDGPEHSETSIGGVTQSASRRGSETIELLASRSLSVRPETMASYARTPGISLDGPIPDRLSSAVIPGRDDLEQLQSRVKSENHADQNCAPTALLTLSALSETCRHLRTLIWPLLVGKLKLSLSALHDNSVDRIADIRSRVSLLRGHVRLVCGRTS